MAQLLRLLIGLRRVLQAPLHLAAGEGLEGVGIQAVQEVLVRPVGVGVGEEVVVEPDLGVQSGGGVHPVEGRALDLAAIGGVAAPALGVIGGQDLGDIAVLVLDAAGAGDEVGAFQAALGAIGGEALILGHGDFQEVVGLDPEVPGEADLPGPGGGVHGVILHGDSLGLALGVVGDGELHRVEDTHDPLGGLVEVLPEAVLQEAVLHHVGGLGDADALTEVPDGAGGVAPAAQAAEGGHPGIVPAGDSPLLHQPAELALAHDGVVDAETGELDLPGMGGQVAVLDDPVIEGPVGLKLQRAEGVGDALQRILDGVGEVIHGVDAPLVPLAVVVHIVDAVEDGVPHVEVAGGQVDLGPEGVLALGELAPAHPLKEVQTLLHGAVPPGAAGGGADTAPVFLELLRGKLADIGEAFPDQAHRLAVILLKVVRAVEEAVAPVEAQPVDVPLDGVHELHILLGGVGVVHPEVAEAAELLRRAEVDGQGLAVADVQVAVGLRREAGVDGHALELSAGGDILRDKRVDEVAALAALGLHGLALVCHMLLPSLLWVSGRAGKDSDEKL